MLHSTTMTVDITSHRDLCTWLECAMLLFRCGTDWGLLLFMFAFVLLLLLFQVDEVVVYTQF